jgi:hypothetical protein
MREKVEREGLGKHSSQPLGGVRLTEFTHERGSNFVRRLNKEAVSFFFTNFPEELLVVDLWRVFAKYGRVGEVYVPNKVDRRGRRFGFAKFLEVLNVEELSRQLEEVWCGSFKLKVNLSRFGRTNNTKPKNPMAKDSEVMKSREDEGKHRKSFLDALDGGQSNSTKLEKGKGQKANEAQNVMSPRASPLCFEPDTEFMSVLECSSVGRLAEGRNIKELQLNLCLEGYRNIRVASMGDGRILIFSQAGEDIGLAIQKKVWWEGILDDIRPWNPMMVASNRETWVRVFGVPVQLWRDEVFRMILKPWGEVIGLDDETSRGVRFDVGRVKISAPMSCNIDFCQDIVSQGIKFVVRVIEERGAPIEFVHVSKDEDQLGWSAAASCDSGDMGGRAPEEAMAEGGVFGDADSDGSEQSMQSESVMEKAQQHNLVDNDLERICPKGSFTESGNARSIPSNVHAKETKGVDSWCGGVVEAEEVRGLTSSSSGARAVCNDEDRSVKRVGPIMKESKILLAVKSDTGPSLLGQTDGCEADLGRLVEDSGGAGNPACLVDPGFSNGHVEVPLTDNVISKLDVLVRKAKGAILERNVQEFSQETSNLSSSSSSSVRGDNPNNQNKSKRHKNPLSRLPFPHLVGPKCLRLMEVVNSVSGSCRRKKTSEVGGGIRAQFRRRILGVTKRAFREWSLPQSLL